MDFKQANKLFNLYKSQFEQRQISEQELESLVNEIRVTEATGEMWQIGVRTGTWYRYDGQNWAEAIPPTIRPTEQNTSFEPPPPPVEQTSLPPKTSFRESLTVPVSSLIQKGSAIQQQGHPGLAIGSLAAGGLGLVLAALSICVVSMSGPKWLMCCSVPFAITGLGLGLFGMRSFRRGMAVWGMALSAFSFLLVLLLIILVIVLSVLPTS
jgi:hypothetical protein